MNNTMLWVQNVILLTAIPSFLALSFGLFISLFKQVDKLKKAIVVFATISCSFDLVWRVLWLNGQHSNYLNNLYVMVEIVILLLIYKISVQSILPQYAVEGLLGLFFLFCICNMGFFEGFYAFNIYTRTLESLILILFSLLYFYKIMHTLDSEYLFKEPMFWLNAGVLLYFSANLFIFVFCQYMSKYSLDLNALIWTIHLIFLTAFFALLSIALWVTPLRNKTHESSLSQQTRS